MKIIEGHRRCKNKIITAKNTLRNMQNDLEKNQAKEKCFKRLKKIIGKEY